MPTRSTDDATAPDGGRFLNLEAGRRAFLRSVGLGAGALALAGVAGPREAAAQTLDDTTILNFALNLEYLEAEFYLQAAFGRGLAADDTTGTGNRGNVAGGKQVQFTNRNIRLYAEEIASDEEAHVKFLRSALGSAAIARPAININQAFTLAARAAGLVGPQQQFYAYANDSNFLLAAFIFEDVGVTAYKGAAPLISDPAILAAAAGLLGTEAYHAGIIRTALFARGLFAEAKAISELRDTADGVGQRDQPIGNGSGANLVPTDASGLVFSRSVRQVLSIVYLGGDGEGGFYPAGINL